MELAEILRCPKTGNRLRFEGSDSVVYVECSDVTYPITDGIIDFCTQAKDTISTSYDAFAPLYDSYITSSNVAMKVCNRILGWTSDDYTYFANALPSYFPSQFSGVLLDVPVGTGVFTSSLYAGFPNATIIAIDYSMGMLRKAQSRFQQHGLTNVCLIRADVANLPVKDTAVDIVLSMNGLHVFPDKQRAVAEMRRVIREQGRLVACCYVTGGSKSSDWFVKYFGVRRGFFNAPFFHADGIVSELEGFTMGRQENVKSLAYFEAIKTS